MFIEDPESGTSWLIQRCDHTSEGYGIYEISNLCTAEDLISIAAYLLRHEGRSEEFSMDARVLYGAFSRGKSFREVEEEEEVP